MDLKTKLAIDCLCIMFQLRNILSNRISDIRTEQIQRTTIAKHGKNIQSYHDLKLGIVKAWALLIPCHVALRLCALLMQRPGVILISLNNKALYLKKIHVMFY